MVFPNGRSSTPAFKAFFEITSPMLWRYSSFSPVSISNARIVPSRRRFFVGKRESLTANLVGYVLWRRMTWSIWNLNSPSCNRSRLALATAQARGFAVQECPWKKVLVLSSLTNASNIFCVQAVAPNGSMPPVIPLLKQMMSGFSTVYSLANILPVR